MVLYHEHYIRLYHYLITYSWNQFIQTWAFTCKIRLISPFYIKHYHFLYCNNATTFVNVTCVFIWPPTSMKYPSPGHRCCCIVWASAINAAAWLRHKTDYCAFLLERREPHGVPSPCSHTCMGCAAVCLTVMPSFSDTTDVSTIGHSFKTDRIRTPLVHVAQYGDDITGRELNLRNCPVGSGSRTNNLSNSGDRWR